MIWMRFRRLFDVNWISFILKWIYIMKSWKSKCQFIELCRSSKKSNLDFEIIKIKKKLTLKWFKENSCQKLSTFNLYEGTVKVLFETEYNNLNRESKTLNKLLFDQRSNPSKPGSAGAPPPPMPPMPPIMDVKNCMNFRIIPKVLAFLSINSEKGEKMKNIKNSRIKPIRTKYYHYWQTELFYKERIYGVRVARILLRIGRLDPGKISFVCPSVALVDSIHQLNMYGPQILHHLLL